MEKQQIPTGSCILICDTRERHVTRHESELPRGMLIQQITVGDYIITDHDGKVLVVIERKSLEDFAASFKDGRHMNKQKLIDLRAQTGCRIMYIIEGPAYPHPNDYFGNIAYKNIESSIFHLMIRDNISIMNTENSLGTAKMLSRMVDSMNTLCMRESSNFIGESFEAPNETISLMGASDTMALITTRHVKSDADIVRELWSCFPGITVDSASDYMRHWSLADIVRGRIAREVIMQFKLTSGRKINKKAADSLCSVAKSVEIRLLATIPGISRDMATIMVSKTPLSTLLSYGQEISIEVCGKNSRRLGDKLAGRVVALFNFRMDAPDEK